MPKTPGAATAASRLIMQSHMDATYIVFALAAWCVISIPAALLIGTAIAVGTEEPPTAMEVKHAA